jgi:hypothetical protein
MSTPRPGTPGAVRECPHCKESILESAAVCPACKHHLRFDDGLAAIATHGHTPLHIEGSFRNPADNLDWEYSLIVTIRNERGQEIARKLIGVGALNPNEQRSFSLSVEMAPSNAKGSGKNRTRH